MVLTERMVPEVVQPFWPALQRGEFMSGAVESVGASLTYRVHSGRVWAQCPRRPNGCFPL